MKRKHIAISVVAVIAIAALIFAYVKRSKEREADTGEDQPISAKSTVEQTNGMTVIHLDLKAQQLAGLQTETVCAGRRRAGGFCQRRHVVGRLASRLRHAVRHHDEKFIMLISHYGHLVNVEGTKWDLETALRGASERLLPILMTAIVTALGLLPLAMGTGTAGHEIEGPMALVILGGLIASTLLNLLVLPALALRFGRFEKIFSAENHFQKIQP